MSTGVTELSLRLELAPVFPYALAPNARMTEQRKRLREALTVLGVQLALKQLQRPVLCLPAARRRDTR